MVNLNVTWHVTFLFWFCSFTCTVELFYSLLLFSSCTVPYNLVFLFNVGLRFFLCNVRKCWCSICSKKKNCWKVMLFRWHYTGFFSCAMLSQEYYNNIEQDFLHAQCCLEPLGLHCTRFLPIQYCPKTVKKIVTWAESCKYVILLVSRILWH